MLLVFSFSKVFLIVDGHFNCTWRTLQDDVFKWLWHRFCIEVLNHALAKSDRFLIWVIWVSFFDVLLRVFHFSIFFFTFFWIYWTLMFCLNGFDMFVEFFLSIYKFLCFGCEFLNCGRVDKTCGGLFSGFVYFLITLNPMWNGAYINCMYFFLFYDVMLNVLYLFVSWVLIILGLLCLKQIQETHLHVCFRILPKMPTTTSNHLYKINNECR